MDQPTKEQVPETVVSAGPRSQFPETPFENIAFALSGGGYRAAGFGLGVLSLFHQLKITEPGMRSTLLEKIKFVSSASGGTITLSLYKAAIHKGIPFDTFYHHLNDQMTGEALIEKAIGLLNDDNEWLHSTKRRNLINAFAKAYHADLFSLLPNEADRCLGFIMTDDHSPVKPHIEEFCFNTSEFYTGLSFRFQASGDWSGSQGPLFGNSTININSENKKIALATLKSIRLADVLAASSCFPLGFEPMLYPNDFSYAHGPSVQSLKEALKLEMYSYDENNTEEENKRSQRAMAEKKFSETGEFGLMDGGICDNQGLYSLLLANQRKGKTANAGAKDANRFDLMMVSDVTSFYMKPYSDPAIPTGKSWMKNSPAYYWTKIKSCWQTAKKWRTRGYLIGIAVAFLLLLPLVLEGVSVASVVLALVGIIPLIFVLVVDGKIRKFMRKNPAVVSALGQPTLQDLFKQVFPQDTFQHRTAFKVIEYLQRTETGVIGQMVLSRALSASTMIGDIFLKHIRRLIYDTLFDNPRYKYRRLNNVIYKLTYSNNKNRRYPAFDDQEDESRDLYEARREAFRREVDDSCLLSPEMQKIAEAAYNAGTTLWFEKEQEASPVNTRKSIIATGQFTTCYNLLSYALSLKHSRYFVTLEKKYQERTESLITQMKDMMKAFHTNPYYLYQQMEEGGS